MIPALAAFIELQQACAGIAKWKGGGLQSLSARVRFPLPAFNRGDQVYPSIPFYKASPLGLGRNLLDAKKAGV